MKKMLLAIVFFGGVAFVNAKQELLSIQKKYTENGIQVNFTYENRNIYAGAHNQIKPYMTLCGQGTVTPWANVIAVRLDNTIVNKDKSIFNGARVFLPSNLESDKIQPSCEDVCGIQLNNIASFISRQVKIENSSKVDNSKDKEFTKHLLKEDGSVKYKFEFVYKTNPSPERARENSRYVEISYKSASDPYTQKFCGSSRPSCLCKGTAL